MPILGQDWLRLEKKDDFHYHRRDDFVRHQKKVIFVAQQTFWRSVYDDLWAMWTRLVATVIRRREADSKSY